jgi:hypothetical protein
MAQFIPQGAISSAGLGSILFIFRLTIKWELGFQGEAEKDQVRLNRSVSRLFM